MIGHAQPAGAPSLVCARSGLRLARNAAFTAALLLFVALPQAASASLSWSGPITLDHNAGSKLDAVACPSTGQCTAVDGAGRQVTFDPTSPGTPTPTTIDTYALEGVACPSTSQCTAVDLAKRQVTFDPASPGTPTPATIDGPIDGTNTPRGVACPSTSECTAVDVAGRQVTFDPASAGTPTPTPIDSTNPLLGVACPSTSQCTAVDDDGQQVTFDPTSPGTPTPTTIDSTNGLEAVACPSASQCTAVDFEGRQVTFDPTSPGTPAPTPIDSNAPDVRRCPGATGTMTGTSIGQIRLGMTRSRARHLYRHHFDRGKKYEDFFCLTPIGVRVGYASPKLLAAIPKNKRGGYAGKVVWASTSNRYYELDNIRPGESLAKASTQLHLEKPFHIGLNYWYLDRTSGYTAVLKVRGGVVEELGIATNALTETRKTQVVLMHSFY